MGINNRSDEKARELVQAVTNCLFDTGLRIGKDDVVKVVLFVVDQIAANEHALVEKHQIVIQYSYDERFWERVKDSIIWKGLH